MRKFSTVLFVLFLVATSGCFFSSSGGGPVPRPAPYTKFFMLNGEQVPLEAYRGQITAVVFWGSWCSSSKSTLRRLDKIAAELSSNRFVVLAVSLDRESDEDKVNAFLDYASLSHVQFAYSGNESLDEAYLSFKAEDVPHIFIVNELGTIVLQSRSAGDVEEYLEKRGLL